MVRKIKNNNDLRNQRYLEKLSISNLIDKIDNFRKLDFKTISKKELSSEINEVLENENGKTVIPVRIFTYSVGTKFYRIRKINNDSLIIPLKEMKKESDGWNPPSHVVGWGRLNKPGESLLYTTPENVNVPIEEMKILEGEYFALMVYEAKEPIKVNPIGFGKNYSGLRENERNKRKMLDNFLKHEFIREVGVGTEHLYRISEEITKTYFDLPPRDIQDAWCYPSIAKKSGFNVCFRPDIAREKLNLLGVQILSYKNHDIKKSF